MSNSNYRILLNITMIPNNNPSAQKKAESTYFRVNNILSKNGQFPNISDICNYCDNVNRELGAYIRNKCLEISKEDTIFDKNSSKINSILNRVDSSKRKNIRIVLYPGQRSDIDDLNMSDTTHNMIVQFKPSSSNFVPTEPHNSPPCFYQVCNSEENAILFFEALLVDACICHYLGISDVAYFHDEKQRISSEKVMFLREMYQNKGLKFHSSGAQKLFEYVSSQLNDTTPYISFLSIFTVAQLDILEKKDISEFTFFEDYCYLWSEFQKWYFEKHGRMFIQNTKAENPLYNIFFRNKYQGQISPSEIETSINNLLNTKIIATPNPPFGEEHRYAVLVIKHVPATELRIAQFKALSFKDSHQAKWKIIHWSDLKKYDEIISYLEVVPFIIIPQS